MNLQTYLNLSNEEYEFLLEEATFQELEIIYYCLDNSGDFACVEASQICDKYLTEFNRRKENMSK